MLPKFNTSYLILITLILFFFFPSSHQKSCNSQDEASLLAFSAHLSTSSVPPLNWSSSITCCSWEGVDCDVNGRVADLRLRSRGLQGEISYSIKNLDKLNHLDLSKNLFSGDLPIGLFESLSSLQVFNLSFNSLEGNFSSSLSFRGTLPTTILTIDISNNNFHGLIESSMFSGASNLSSFNCSKNGFTGPIPSSICMSSPLLKGLDFAENTFSGHIPPSLMNCTNLESLSFRINMLEGDISTLDFAKLARLQKLDLSRNLFTGPFPDGLYSCKELVAVRVASNYFSGQISPKIAELSSLSFLSLTNNSFTNITSTLRIFAGSKSLTFLFLGYNFYGEYLPSERNFLGSNGFPNLQFLSVLSCNLTGNFPEWISNMKNVRILHLGHNRLKGTIPKWLAALPKLFALELSNNLLSGEIPLELCHLPALVSPATLSNLNQFYFDLPVFSLFSGRHTWDQFVVYPPQMSIQNNSITGTIPSEISKLQNLHMLYLNGNNLSGEIPDQISDLKNLEQLSLAKNQLTGEIPVSFKSLNFLSTFNVSHNHLQGPIPTGGQFDTFQASSYEGNPDLCGQALQRPCDSAQNDQPDHVDEEDDGKIEFFGGLAFGFVSGFTIILAFVASWVWYKNLHKQQDEVEDSAPMEEQRILKPTNLHKQQDEVEDSASNSMEEQRILEPTI